MSPEIACGSLIDILSADMSIKQIIEDHPELKREDILASPDDTKDY
ncbi:MAG: hypothetical protein BroJett042_04100 [Bacteroidota bacterium]|nr:MAG: hypothetical protein BroJett042_04100 [Bacteroidota bacterium]